MRLVNSSLTRGLSLSLTVAATLLVASTTAHAHTWHVDGNNVSGIEDGSAEHPYVLISSAMDQAAYGDTVLVMPGEYSEWLGADMHDPMSMNTAAVVMRDGVALISGAGPEETTIHGYSTQGGVYFGDCGPETVVSGFRICGSGVGWGVRTGVFVYGGAPRIVGNQLHLYYPDIYCRGAATPTIAENVIGVDDPAMPEGYVYLSDGSAGTISDNVLFGAGIGVSTSLPLTDTLRVHANSVQGTDPSGSAAGVSVGPCDPELVKIVGNSVTGKATAIKMCGGTLRGNILSGNTVALEAAMACSQRDGIDAQMNWWGTVDSLAIQTLIVDCHDDASRPCVDFSPWCADSECSSSNVQNLTWGRIKSLYRSSAGDSPGPSIYDGGSRRGGLE